MARRSGRRRSFGYLRRLPGGNMQASYVGPDGQRHTASSTFVDGGYAQGWLADERRLISDGRWTPPAVRQAEQIAQAAREDAMVTVEQWIDVVIERRRSRPHRPVSPTTVDLYRKDARLRITGTDLGRRKLDHVSRADVVRWWDQLPSTPTTNARAYQLLSSVMKEALDDELIEVSPCHLKGASKPRPRHSAATMEALSADQTLAYMLAVPQHYRVALMVAAWCGLRSGEVRGLRRRDVDLRAKVFHVEQAVNRVRLDDHHLDATPRSMPASGSWPCVLSSSTRCEPGWQPFPCVAGTPWCSPPATGPTRWPRRCCGRPTTRGAWPSADRNSPFMICGARPRPWPLRAGPPPPSSCGCSATPLPP